MPILPAFCDRCGAVFPSGIYAGDGATLNINNVSSGTCPRCGGTIRMKNGVFNVVNGVISEIKKNNYSKEDLVELVDILKSLQHNENSEPELTKEETNRYSWIFRFLPENLGDKIAIIAIIIDVILSFSSQPTINYNIDIDVEQVIQNNYYDTDNQGSFKNLNTRYTEPNRKMKPIGKRNPHIKQEKPGRNDPCPCGSGKKYKKCHGI